MFEKIKARLTSKTYIAALLMAIFTVIEANTALVSTWLPVEIRPYLPLLWMPVMMTLREVTTSALSEK